MKNRVKLFCISIIMILMLFAGAFVIPECSLTIHLAFADASTNAEGIEIELIQVADLKDSGLVYCSPFSSFEKDIGSLEEHGYTKALSSFIDQNKITGVKKSTDKDGYVVFDKLTPGVYYSREINIKENSPVFEPFLTVIPTDGKYDVTAEPKTIAVGTSETELTVKKVWNDDGKNRPSSVKVMLKNEEGVKQTVTLNSSNDWTYKWEGLDSKKTWTIEEIDIPSGYKASYSTEGKVCTITNTAKLIQTGQTNWPMPVLFFAGILFISAGVMLKIIGKGREDEK